MMRFRRKHPGIFVHLHNVTGADGLGMIRNDDVDFAVGSMLDVPDDIDYRPIWHFNPALITSRDHPLARRSEVDLAAISPHGLILPPRRLSTYQLVDLVFQKHRSEEHTSELQSRGHLVCRLLLEKKKYARHKPQ